MAIVITPRGPDAVKTHSDPTNLDHVAFSIVGLGVVGWLVSLLLR
jgi:hypothetical protein